MPKVRTRRYYLQRHLTEIKGNIGWILHHLKQIKTLVSVAGEPLGQSGEQITKWTDTMTELVSTTGELVESFEKAV